MKKQQPISGASVASVAALVLASAGTLLANGQSFFIPAGRGPVELVYFARVKDARTGRPIQKPPYVTIVDPFTGICHSFPGRRPGTFQEPGHRRRDPGSQLPAHRHQGDGNHGQRGGL